MSSEEATAEPTTEALVNVRGIGIIAIHVSDLDRSVSFYRKMLGFVEGEQMLEPGVTLTAGDLSIYLVPGSPAVERVPLSGPELSLCMVARGVRECHRKLKDAGVKIVAEFEEASPYFSSFSFADPDGNLLEIWGQP
jgi:catechol 2,3-dioxygenase-like lactoylglutathione lyase family enzyme